MRQIDGLAKRVREPGFMSRVLRLTLLAPESVEAALEGRQPTRLQLDDLVGLFLPVSERQRFHVG